MEVLFVYPGLDGARRTNAKFSQSRCKKFTGRSCLMPKAVIPSGSITDSSDPHFDIDLVSVGFSGTVI
ncbi:MAG: hypothetical protein CME01_05060 [Geminicoccus sp.]|nr:hypothetical protein [Geminicoccus sp.]